jgi:hypothetical protein
MKLSRSGIGSVDHLSRINLTLGNTLAPSAIEAARAANSAVPSSFSHVLIVKGNPGSSPCSVRSNAVANSCELRFERTNSHVALDGDCRIGRNIAGFDTYPALMVEIIHDE